MNVAFLTPSVSRNLGGIYEIERDLAQALVSSTPASVDVVGLEDEHTAADLPDWKPLEPQVLPVTGPAAFGYAPGLLDRLLDLNADLVHLHALWMYPSWASLQWSRRTRRPHVVTINGMLDDWALNNSRWKKRIAGWLYENANLREAACLQVNTEPERRAVRDYGLDTPVCTIPNGVSLPPRDVPSTPPWTNEVPPDQRVLLFLGRIHPKKGLDILIDAWRRFQHTHGDVAKDWTIAVVGWDDGGHIDRLRRQADDAGCASDIRFLGPLFGQEKHAAFHHADAFVLPSHSEGLPMAVLEAWSHRLPVVMTPGCNLPEGPARHAALEVEPTPEEVADGLLTLCQMDPEERRAMGDRGRALVEERFTWPRVAEHMYDVYQWVSGNAEPPDTVRFE
jgi:poly(glycerol-phosphate) alpha-glucosyltransferase